MIDAAKKGKIDGLSPAEINHLVDIFCQPAKAGVDIFGVVVNSSTDRSTPYNLSRMVTFTKAAAEHSPSPIHANSGMGVGGMPMTLLPPVGCSTRCAKALVEIGKADGL